MTEPRQITEEEKRAILASQGPFCFIDHHPIDDPSDIEFDHVNPYSEGGASEPGNIAVVCKKHNREKGSLSLSEFRDRLELRAFFADVPKRRLDDLLTEKLGANGFAQPISMEVSENSIKLFFDGAPPESVPLYTCPATGEKYFYALLPAKHMSNDATLQPRALEPDRLWDLYRHLRTHTQLAPCIGRLVGPQLLLLDGQHKAAAQVWAGRNRIECKIYLNPEVRRIKETNLTAHYELRQMPFYTSTLLEKYADLAHEDWETFLQAPGPKNELEFVKFLRRAGLSKAAAIRRIRASIHRDILDDPENKLRPYVSEATHGRSLHPLTVNRLEKSFFAEFVVAPPLDDEFETDTWHRADERGNLVFLFNEVVARALDGKWNPTADDAAHKKAARLFSAGALRAWVPFLHDAVAPALKLFAAEERRRVFYRPLSESDREVVKTLLSRLLSHKVWDDPNPELIDLRYDNAERAQAILNKAGLTVGWILGHET